MIERDECADRMVLAVTAVERPLRQQLDSVMAVIRDLASAEDAIKRLRTDTPITVALAALEKRDGVIERLVAAVQPEGGSDAS